MLTLMSFLATFFAISDGGSVDDVRPPCLWRLEGRASSKVSYAVFVFDLALELLMLLLVKSSGLLGCTLPKSELLL
jgi:hypothetical protein